MFYVMVILMVVGVVVITSNGIFQWGRDRLDSNRKALVESERTLDKAERALRSIANGAGSPVLEAQIALDEINNYHTKEIN